jgi:hypothetical protein
MEYQQTKFAIRRSAYFVQAAILVVFITIGVAFVFIPNEAAGQKSDKWELVVYTFLVLFGIYYFVAMPLELELTQDGMLKFRSYFRARAFRLDSLTEITIEREDGGLTFRFEKAKISMPGEIDGLPEFYSIIRTRMPHLVIREV